MKLGSPEAMKQEPSNHAWEEREALRERQLEEEERAQEEREYNEMMEARREYDAATPTERAKVLRRCEQCNHEIDEYADGLTLCAACECPHDEHDHGICLDCGKDIFDDLVAAAEFNADCREDR